LLEVLRQVGFFPRACVWELTLACNLRCKHCGSIAGNRRPDELTLDECRRVAEELVALGCRRITLSGGEPTLYPGWDEVGKRLVELGARVNLISNGMTWTPKHVEMAQKAGFCGVAFSIDGFEKEHDEFRTEGSFVRVVKSIDISVAAGLPVSVKTTINRLNQGQLPALRRFLIDHRAFAWQLQFATATGNMGQHRSLVSPPEELLWLVPQMAEMCRIPCPEFKIYPSDDVGYFGRFEPDLRDGDTSMPFWLGCRAGIQVIGIESGGNIKGCLSLPSTMNGETRFIEGNVRKQSLRDIWLRADAFAFNRQFKEEQLTGFCRVCRFRDVCRGGCSWATYAQGGQGNQHCFYYQAVKHGRQDLLSEAPTEAESAFFASAPVAASGAGGQT
jgi:radical SAM protein with 4Fe4S-binding SPASM domain